MKPDWKDAPEWAKHLAMDDDGEWCWFERKPKWGGSQWIVSVAGSRYEIVPRGNGYLERRPETSGTTSEGTT